MKYYYDTEFLEGTQKKLFGRTKPTIDLISIGIVSEDDREYYAISKDFNLKEAWNRYDLKDGKKVYWIRENVLKPIYKELRMRELNEQYGDISDMECFFGDKRYFKELKRLIQQYGKSNKQISSEIIELCKPHREFTVTYPITLNYSHVKNPVFYAYYGAYDHVALCWLFGKMIDLPKGFPMYSIDLKQMLDSLYMKQERKYEELSRIEAWLKDIKSHPEYPIQENAHNALDDAKWNKKLHEFIQSL